MSNEISHSICVEIQELSDKKVREAFTVSKKEIMGELTRNKRKFIVNHEEILKSYYRFCSYFHYDKNFGQAIFSLKKSINMLEENKNLCLIMGKLVDEYQKTGDKNDAVNSTGNIG